MKIWKDDPKVLGQEGVRREGTGEEMRGNRGDNGGQGIGEEMRGNRGDNRDRGQQGQGTGGENEGTTGTGHRERK